MAESREEGVRAELERLAEEERLEAQNRLDSLHNPPDEAKVAQFVADVVINETIGDETGTIPAELLQFEKESFPKIENAEKLDGGSIGKFNEKDPSEFDALIPQTITKPGVPAIPSDIREHLFPPLEEFTNRELIELITRVRAKLPASKLKDLNLEEELVLHFLNLKELMTLTLYDEDIPANQKAQIANSCASLLQQMTKSQSAIYSAERVKRMEMALLKALHGMPQDTLEEFLTRYERIYSAEDL